MSREAPSRDENGEICPGVRELDHTADVGIVVHADSREALFDRAASGMFALVYGDATCPGRSGGGAEHVVNLESRDPSELLLRWLRELLYVQEADGMRFVDATFEELTETRLRARVRVAASSRSAVREMKGVTYHDLEVVRVPDGWRARVVFDV